MTGKTKGKEGSNEEVNIQLHKIDKIVFAGDIKDEEQRQVAELGSPRDIVLTYKKFDGISTKQLFQETWDKLPTIYQCVAEFNATNATKIHHDLASTMNQQIQNTAVLKYTKQATSGCMRK